MIPIACLAAQHKSCSTYIVKEPSTCGHRGPHSLLKQYYLPQTEDKESKQEQPSKDTADEDP
jgi:hypothetical protein